MTTKITRKKKRDPTNVMKIEHLVSQKEKVEFRCSVDARNHCAIETANFLFIVWLLSANL